ncbi:hypothetical protein CFE70_009535 [Pyrenophora teres f. teres 0-1]|uniref:Uncharacterized protein n=1 Tax=Pyrenophora teres f. teres (strain 0-1) TaxID=861557 RepID=E3S7X2_PYRTT|nr:hypothetical protein PTT_18972 [Pyrenophora teres f. teres 0-1]
MPVVDGSSNKWGGYDCCDYYHGLPGLDELFRNYSLWPRWQEHDGFYGLCYSDIKLKSLGAQSSFTRIYCDWTGRHDALATSVYEILPASAISTPTTSAVLAPSASPSNRTPNPLATPTSSSPPSSTSTATSPKPSSNNTGIIAGSVVGGLAVIAIAGVAILYILKRSKRHDASLHSSPKDAANPYDGRPEMAGNAFQEAPGYSAGAIKYGHAINGGEMDAQEVAVEAGGREVGVEGRR